jgi:protein tyrosine/serine phosphatase
MHRLIALEGCLNFRDLGGYPTAGGKQVRWRRVFRSDALHAVTPADVARLCCEIGLGTVIDLRSTAELHADGEGPLQREGIAHHHVPLFDGKTIWPVERPAEVTLSDRYWLLAEYAKDKIARVLGTLAAADGPAVYHCAAGKDRTGVISAVLLGVLDVPDEVIVADYVATRENLDAIIERLRGMESYKSVLSALPEDTLHAEAETMSAFLERIRAEYGHMRDYAQAAGVTRDALEALVSRLVEPA